MKAVVLSAVNALAIAEVEKPRPGIKECLVKVLACGICGTDRHIYHGEYPSAKPVILGHEFGGVIEEVGPNSKFKVGQVVSVDPNIVCGTCPDCIAERTAFCPDLTALGVNINGGLAEYVLTPDSQIYPVKADLNPLHLAFIEPLACSIRGLDLANLKGHSVKKIGKSGFLEDLVDIENPEPEIVKSHIVGKKHTIMNIYTNNHIR